MSPEPLTDKTRSFLQLEIPISAKDARRRRLAPHVCKLLIGLQNVSRISLLARLIENLRPSHTMTYVTSAGEFASLTEILRKMDKEGIHVIPGHNLLRVIGDVATEHVLSSWKAEALILFFGSDEIAIQIVSALSSREPNWWEPTSGSYEARFVEQLTLVDPFLFFAESHSSLEVIGTKAAVLRCFDSVRASQLVSD